MTKSILKLIGSRSGKTVLQSWNSVKSLLPKYKSNLTHFSPMYIFELTTNQLGTEILPFIHARKRLKFATGRGATCIGMLTVTGFRCSPAKYKTLNKYDMKKTYFMLIFHLFYKCTRGTKDLIEN